MTDAEMAARWAHGLEWTADGQLKAAKSFYDEIETPVTECEI